MQKVCFDSGVLSIYFGKDVSDRKKIMNILNHITDLQYEVHILAPVLTEVYYHLCKLEGKTSATTRLVSFQSIYPIHIIQLNQDLIFKSGELKCQNRPILSYIDCFSLAYCLIEQIPFHTTEKKLKEIPELITKRIHITAYKWD